MTARQPDYGIAAVTRTAALVAAMVRLGPAPLSQIALEAGCTATGAFRILHTLRALGMAAQDGKRGPWQLGAGWVPIARAAVRHGALARAAAPVLAGFAARHGDPVSFAMRDGEQCEVVAGSSANPPIRSYAAAGDRSPLHAGPGRLLLAYAPEQIVRAVLSTRLSRLGPATRTDPAAVASDLPRIRNRAWLITADEIAGAVTVSVPVREGAGDVAGVLSIVSPTLRMRPPRPHIMLTPLSRLAEELGRALGMGDQPSVTPS